jgi:hypothetical protein
MLHALLAISFSFSNFDLTILKHGMAPSCIKPRALGFRLRETLHLAARASKKQQYGQRLASEPL